MLEGGVVERKSSCFLTFYRWIIGRLKLAEAVTKEDVKEVITEKLLDMKIFKSVSVANSKSAGFKEVKELDWDYHLDVIEEGNKVSSDELLKITESIINEPMDLTKPLWSNFIIIFLISF